MIILATGDFESDYMQLWNLLKKSDEPDIFLTAGDMYNDGNPGHYEIIVEYLEKLKWKCPALACLGNWDEGDRDEIRELCGSRILLLEEESAKMKIKGKTVGVVGSIGCVDSFAWFLPGIWKDFYRERAEKIRQLLLGLGTDVKILLTHYAPSYQTLRGENPFIYENLGYRGLEKILIETKATFAVHGHAHFGVPLGFVGQIPVFNAAFPANSGLVRIDTDSLPKP